jgi:uncharacterized protein YgiM (DUF1202 family)
MKKYNVILTLSLLFACSSMMAQEGLIITDAWIYKNPSFESKTIQSVQAGRTLEILDQSDDTGADLEGNQKYFWYKIKASDQVKGWVFGDSFATLKNPRMVEMDQLVARYLIEKDYHVAMILGESKSNNVYCEKYLFTNSSLPSNGLIPMELNSDELEIDLTFIEDEDINQDGQQDMVLTRVEKDKGKDQTTSKKEWYTVSNSGITMLHQEDIALYSGGKSVPDFNTRITISDQLIHVERISLESINDNVFKPTYSTYSLIWNSRNKLFEEFYPKSVLPLWAYLNTSNNEKISLIAMDRNLENRLGARIRTSSGMEMDVSFDDFHFRNNGLGELIDGYFKKDPLSELGQL